MSQKKETCSVSFNILYCIQISVSSTSPSLHATHTALETNQRGTRGKEDKEDVISYLSLSRVLVAQSWFPACFSGTWCLWGVLVVFIVRWRGGEGEGELMVLRSQLHGNSQHGHAFGRTLYPAPGLIPAVPRESWSVTEQINVYCFLSRLDRPMLTAEAVILPATVEYGMMVHRRALRICELHQ